MNITKDIEPKYKFVIYQILLIYQYYINIFYEKQFKI